MTIGTGQDAGRRSYLAKIGRSVLCLPYSVGPDKKRPIPGSFTTRFAKACSHRVLPQGVTFLCYLVRLSAGSVDDGCWRAQCFNFRDPVRDQSMWFNWRKATYQVVLAASAKLTSGSLAQKPNQRCNHSRPRLATVQSFFQPCVSPEKSSSFNGNLLASDG